MSIRFPLAVGEWYHCYSRGVDKRKTFLSETDYKRFVQIMYLSNSSKKIQRSDLNSKTHVEILQTPRGKKIVALGAYVLMPNHFHMLIGEIQDGGITQFMRKLGTSYAMYFNLKNKRIGNIFVKPFRSKHVGKDNYLKYVAQYIHLNPLELFEPDWKNGIIRNKNNLLEKLGEYTYSSFIDYFGHDRVERGLLDKSIFDLLKNDMPTPKTIVSDATEYYKNNSEL
ncbi:MAG: transposase [Patescibacteria group bacterium]